MRETVQQRMQNKQGHHTYGEWNLYQNEIIHIQRRLHHFDFHHFLLFFLGEESLPNSRLSLFLTSSEVL